MLNHDEEDVLHDHNATEGKDHQVRHPEQEPEIRNVVEDVIQRVAIHRRKARKHGKGNVLVTPRVPEEAET